MPTVHQLDRCKIKIHPDDHNSPHFHVRGKGWSYVVEIKTLEVTRGKRPPGSSDGAIEWAADNLDYLLRKWSEYNERD